jgi:hypothetical protein
MLTDLDLTLKELLVKRVPLDPAAVAISFDCPTRAWSARIEGPTVNLYLFDLRENVPLRQGGPVQEKGTPGPNGQSAPGGTRRPPTVFDLSYLITVWAPDVATEHGLLWRVMTTLMRETQIGPDLLQGDLKKVGTPIKTATAQWDGVARKPGDLWGILDNELRPGITYTATVSVAIHPLLPAPPVLTRVARTGSMRRTQRQTSIAIGGIVRTRPTGEKGAPQRVIANAEVSFPQLGITVRSDGDGRYVVPQIPEGKHRVRVVTTAGAGAESEVQVPAPNYNLEV